MKRIVCFCLCLLALLALPIAAARSEGAGAGAGEDAGIGPGAVGTDPAAATPAAKPFTGTSGFAAPEGEALLEGYTPVAASGALELYYDAQAVGIAVRDLRSGYIWTSAVNDLEYPDRPTGQKLRRDMSSLFQLYYSDVAEDKGRVWNGYSANLELSARAFESENGIRLDYDFPEASIKFSIVFKLEDDALTVSIPFSSIVEDGIYALTKIQLLPYFGSVSDDVPGYIFYPDGAGAIYEFDARGRRDAGREELALPVYGLPYGVDTLDIASLGDYFSNYNNNVQQVCMPVFGLKRGNAGYVAIITEGDFDAGIYVNPSGYIKINRASCEFIYRNLYERAALNIGFGSFIGPTEYTVKLDKEIIPGDRSVRYCFLSGDEADYNGMAIKYREYLLETGAISKQEREGSPIYIDFLMGVRQPTILFDKKIRMTTFERAMELLEYMASNGAEGVEANLLGWTGSGYGIHGTDMSPAGWLGGGSGLRKLADLCERLGYGLSLQGNLTRANEKSKGFQPRRDGALRGNGLVGQDWDYNGNFPYMNYLMNPGRASTRLDKLLKSAGKYSVSGLVFEDLGSFAYRDYKKNDPYFRQETVDRWIGYIGQAAGKGFSTAVTGGNAYMFPEVDRLLDVPSTSSGLFLETGSVPFYQIVLHGYLPYSGKAGNTFYDIAREKLMWIEMGCVPYFLLTWETNDELVNTDWNSFYSTYYADWSDFVLEIGREFNGALADVLWQPIARHERLTGGLTRVTYENGVSIYINYEESVAVYEGVAVGALSYAIVRP